MIIRNSFVVPLPPDDAWKVLLDVPSIVSCVPGAELVESRGEHEYVGRMKVKLGPVAVQFAGTVALEDIDPLHYRATARAKGSEMKSRGGATALTRFAVQGLPGNRSQVDIETDLQLSGMVAQYGRGAGVISAMAQQIVDAFAASLAERIEAGRAQATPTAPGAVPVRTKELSVLSLLFHAVLAWLRSITGRRAARPDRSRA